MANVVHASEVLLVMQKSLCYSEHSDRTSSLSSRDKTEKREQAHGLGHLDDNLNKVFFQMFEIQRP